MPQRRTESRVAGRNQALGAGGDEVAVVEVLQATHLDTMTSVARENEDAVPLVACDIACDSASAHCISSLKMWPWWAPSDELPSRRRHVVTSRCAGTRSRNRRPRSSGLYEESR